MADTAIKEGDPRFKFGPTKVQTAEDAALAYMRGEITEEEFRDACGRYGVLPGQLLKTNVKGERPDNAFENKLPDDIYEAEDNPVDTVETRQKIADIKQNTREEATKLHEEAATELEKVTKVSDDPELAQKQQELAEKESEELAKVTEEAQSGDDSSSASKPAATTTKSSTSSSTTTTK